MQKNDHPRQTGLRSKLFHRLGIQNGVQIKVYNGYGHMEKMVLYGHVLKIGPKPVKHYRKSVVHNALALLRLFVVKPYGGIEVLLKWEGKTYTAKTDIDGFYRFEWKDEPPLTPGWHDVEVAVRSPEGVVSPIWLYLRY
jgi:phosphatidate phosphatase APP1